MKPVLLALALAGCAAAPAGPNRALDEARDTLRLAAVDPQVQLRAPVELTLAERALGEAERLWRAGAAAPAVEHQAYVAGQRARIAMKTAEYRDAEAKVATAGEQRLRMLLEAREREASQAREPGRTLN